MDFGLIFKILLFGAIEGITEWLPVSSTGHLKLFHAFFPLPFSPEFLETFEYVIQFFAILAVFILYFKKLFPFSRQETTGKPILKKQTLHLWGKIFLACLPAIVALPLDMLLSRFSSTRTETAIVAFALLFYGVLFLKIEKKNENKAPRFLSVEEMPTKTAFFVGCFQVLAVVPGTSRSGITVLGALLLGVSRSTATEFTFLLALPTMIGASGYKILTFFLNGGRFSGVETEALLLGCAVAFFLSLCTVKWLTNFVRTHTFRPFGVYRIVLGLFVLLALVIPFL